MKRLALGILLALLLVTGVVAAQDSSITLTPFTDEIFGISGVIPEGWTDAGAGLHARGSSATDNVLIALQAAPIDADTLMSSLLPQFGLQTAPESVGTLETDVFTWTLYKIDITAGANNITVDLALASLDGKTYIALLQAPPEEYDALHESVFIPILESLAPYVPEATEEVPYLQEEVTFENGDIILSGTLTLPETEGPHPAVVLITGSGPQDRDESLAPVAAIKPFKLIADALTRAGVAVLRYDDRGTARSSGDFNAATSEDFMSDAAAAIDYLMTREEIDPEQIGVLGHSEGGLIAAMLGASNENVAFIVSMAGTAVPGSEILLKQNQLILEVSGASEERIASQMDFLQQAFVLIEAEDHEALDALLAETIREQVEMLPEDQRAGISDIDAYVEQTIAQQKDFFAGPWMKFFLSYDPGKDWAQTTVPVLGVFGGLDLQVPADQNAPALEAALEAAGNEDYSIVTLPDANHLMQSATTGSPSEYGTLEQTFTPDFLPTVVDWVLEHVTISA